MDVLVGILVFGCVFLLVWGSGQRFVSPRAPVDLSKGWPPIPGPLPPPPAVPPHPPPWEGDPRVWERAPAVPTGDATARLLAKTASAELRHAGAALKHAAEALKDHKKGYSASQAYQAGQRADAAAEEMASA